MSPTTSQKKSIRHLFTLCLWKTEPRQRLVVSPSDDRDRYSRSFSWSRSSLSSWACLPTLDDEHLEIGIRLAQSFRKAPNCLKDGDSDKQIVDRPTDQPNELDSAN